MLDSFTAGMLLEALSKGADVNEVADLYKTFNTEEGGPTEEQIQWFNEHQDKEVLCFGEQKGTVHKLNQSSSGLYYGRRYPIYVKLDGGKIYEYGIENLTLVEGQ